MKPFYLVSLSILLLLSTGCSKPETEMPTVDAGQLQITAQSETQKLNNLLDEHFAEEMARYPIYATFVGINKYNDQFEAPISEQSIVESLAFEQRYLNAIESIDGSQLSGQDWLSYEIFKGDREQAIAAYEFEDYLMPLTQMNGVHIWYPILGAGGNAQPFNTELDYRNFIKRSDGFASYMRSTVDAMQNGIEKNIVLPMPIVEKLLNQLAAHVVENAGESVFFGPIAMLEKNQSIPAETKQALTTDFNAMITDTIIPAYKYVHDFVKQTYLPAARTTVGLSALPNGKKRYEFEIAVNTTLPLSASELHQFGQSEVARILAEMTKVKETVEFEGDLMAFFEFLRTDEQFFFTSEQALIDGYTQIKTKIDARVPQLFEVFPKADYIVKPVEAFLAESAAGASYQGPAPDGSRPGIFYINTHNLKAQPKYLMETLSIHEAAPGHHFQIAIQQEVEDLPDFRKFGGYTVFAEGWALYAESLGKELGLFTDPYMWYGRLSDEQLRAMRLVVDTGLHAFDWSREQAIDFMLTNSSMAESDVVAEVERYISMPGQALAYKAGERHIRRLREKASAALVDKFDIRQFHTQILIDGAMPMPLLETKIDKWIARQR